MAPTVCPVCGAGVPPNAKACPTCGSCEATGWSEQARYDELDLPEQDFDYEDFVQREFGGKPTKPRGVSWLWVGVAVLALLAYLLMVAY